MTLTASVLLVVGGLVLLVAGGEALVRGATALALAARITPVVVGLTVVAAGTSAPELVVSLSASLSGSPDVSLGNVVGSNIANVALVLGVAALVRPLVVRSEVVRLQWPVMFLAACLLHLLARDGTLDRLEGGFLALGLVIFITWQVRLARREVASEEASELVAEAERRDLASHALTAGAVLGGAALLAGGAWMMVRGAVELAGAAGVSERVVGLTVVAVGTSLPELVTSAAASWRGHDDIAVANVVGSNIFNVLGILGLTALVHPVAVNPAVVAWDDWWMLAAALLLLPLMWSGMRIARGEGGLLLGLYGLYVASLLLR